MDELNKINDDINLIELFRTFYAGRLIIISFTSIFAIISIIYALSLSNYYTSFALLAPKTDNDSLTSGLSSYSSLARLGGIELPSSGGSDTKEAIERMQSFEFFSSYFLPFIRLENLMAIDEWIPQQNKIIYDKKKFDQNSGKWVRKVSYPFKKIPSNQEAYLSYKEVLNVNTNTDTGFVTISVTHQSPYIAKIWLDTIIFNINKTMQEIDKENSQNSIDFLNSLTSSTNVQSIKEVISKLLESQMQTLMLASSSDAYVFEVLDSPIIPEIKSGPNRAMICIYITLFGFVVSLFLVLIINAYRLRN
jgi:capsule polysaccharide export protein KpsE/RkpR